MSFMRNDEQYRHGYPRPDLPDPSETVEVLACITPLGQVVFATTRKEAQRVCQNWRNELTDAQAKEHQASATMGGFVTVRMLKRDYDQIPATVESWKLCREGTNLSEGDAGE